MANKTENKKAVKKTKKAVEEKAAPKAEVKVEEKVEAKAEAPRAPKPKTSKEVQLSESFLINQAYHGTRDVPREYGKFVEYKTENIEPLDYLKKIQSAFPKAKFTTAPNIAGVILRMRTDAHPKAEIRLITHNSQKGMIGFGKPIMKGSPTKTNGIALENMGKLDGLENQGNKAGKYWWIKPTEKNLKTLCKFIAQVGF